MTALFFKGGLGLMGPDPILCFHYCATPPGALHNSGSGEGSGPTRPDPILCFHYCATPPGALHNSGSREGSGPARPRPPSSKGVLVSWGQTLSSATTVVQPLQERCAIAGAGKGLAPRDQGGLSCGLVLTINHKPKRIFLMYFQISKVYANN